MAPTNAELIKGIICEGFFIIALGLLLVKNIKWNSSLKWWIHIQQQGVLKKRSISS
jgi:hypothetical protein